MSNAVYPPMPAGSNVPEPPIDSSGGFVVVRITDGIHTHRHRFHVRGAEDTIGTYIAPPVGPAVGIGSANEVTVTDTFVQYMTRYMALYSEAWSAIFESYWRAETEPLGTPQRMVEQFPPPTPTPIAGTLGGGDPRNTNDLAIQGTISMKTINGGRARVTVIASGLVKMAHPLPRVIGATTVTPAINYNDYDARLMALVNYLATTTTGVCGHDGFQLTAYGKLTIVDNKRIRRSLGWT